MLQRLLLGVLARPRVMHGLATAPCAEHNDSELPRYCCGFLVSSLCSMWCYSAGSANSLCYAAAGYSYKLGPRCQVAPPRLQTRAARRFTCGCTSCTPLARWSGGVAPPAQPRRPRNSLGSLARRSRRLYYEYTPRRLRAPLASRSARPFSSHPALTHIGAGRMLGLPESFWAEFSLFLLQSWAAGCS